MGQSKGCLYIGWGSENSEWRLCGLDSTPNAGLFKERAVLQSGLAWDHIAFPQLFY